MGFQARDMLSTLVRLVQLDPTPLAKLSLNGVLEILKRLKSSINVNKDSALVMNVYEGDSVLSYRAATDDRRYVDAGAGGNTRDERRATWWRDTSIDKHR